MGYNSLIKILNKYGANELRLEWENGLQIIGKPDALYETDNGLEDDDINYTEYYAVAFIVKDIIAHPTHNEGRVCDWVIQEGNSYVEISLYDDPPKAVYLVDGQKLWEFDSDEYQ
ncbi:hypothetical protein [Bacillus safensis]|uniref:hypothetical protein n=1 Tax=Bacillus safensis TaxID=561879 RepID=UPI0020C074BE|nr:hypothetical protein [Bacillus safensis]MCK8452254.1 hypothetical protein [Bacillus safensis]